ncbi:beta-propeller fold lactonase family protein [Streptomyces sp. NPDC058572]|uniref:beta-propeller fold lactonase family protein n=1 Tax=Streptomyces sp. NPDC058572 TaxID=3346546 RepID=UPI0036659F87
MSGVTVGAVAAGSAAVRRRGREISWRVKVRTRLAAVGVALTCLALPVAVATPAAADPGTFAYVLGNITGVGFGVAQIDTATNQPTANNFEVTGATDVAVSPDGRRIYVSQSTNAVSVWDATADPPTLINTINLTGAPESLAVSPDGRYVYTANTSSNTVSVIDTTDNSVTDIALTGTPRRLAVSPNGRYVYTANTSSNTVSVIDTTDNNVTDIPYVDADVLSVAVSPSGTRLYVGIGTQLSETDTVSVIDTATNTEVDSIDLAGSDAYPHALVVSADGERLYTANLGTSSVSVIDTATNTVATDIALTTPPADVAITPDDTRVYTTDTGTPLHPDTVTAIDTLTETVIDTFPTNALFPTSMAVAAVPGTATAQCPDATVLTGGGFEITGPFPNYFNSKPVINDTWQISGTNPTTQTNTLTPQAVCGTG